MSKARLRRVSNAAGASVLARSSIAKGSSFRLSVLPSGSVARVSDASTLQKESPVNLKLKYFVGPDEKEEMELKELEGVTSGTVRHEPHAEGSMKLAFIVSKCAMVVYSC